MRVSVVIPTYRRPDLLERCVSALFRQSFDKNDFEIVIADDARCEETAALVESIKRYAPVPINYFHVEGKHGPATARNQGWRRAKGALIAFTDDDCIPDKHWLAGGVASFEPGVDAVSGKTIVPISYPPTDYELNETGLERGLFITANCFYKKEVLETLGGFDENFRMAWREDSDLYFRALRAGFKAISSPKAIVVHPVRPAEWGVSVRLQKKNLFNALLFKKHPDLYRRYIQQSPPWKYYVTLAILAIFLGAVLAENTAASLSFGLIWFFLTVRLCIRRLEKTKKTPAHILEMLYTSAVIPPLAVFWRLCGAFKFRVAFF